MIVHSSKNGNNAIENEIFLSLRVAEEHYRSTPLSQMNNLVFCNNNKKINLTRHFVLNKS